MANRELQHAYEALEQKFNEKQISAADFIKGIRKLTGKRNAKIDELEQRLKHANTRRRQRSHDQQQDQ